MKKLQWFNIATVKSDMYIEMKQTLELLRLFPLLRALGGNGFY